MVDPASVPGLAKLAFFTQSLKLTTMLFQINQPVVPNWFGVAIPNNSVNFDRPNLFFHPIPAQAGYLDGDYQTKTGKWPELYYYMERLGYQVDAAINVYGGPPDQIVIMPFLTSTATTSWILPANWYGIVTDILTQAKAAGGGSGAVTIGELVISSFSAGLFYLNSFRAAAPGLKLSDEGDLGFRRVSPGIRGPTGNYAGLQGAEVRPGCGSNGYCRRDSPLV